MKNKETIVISWDTSEIYQNQIEYLINEEEYTEEEAEELASTDSDMYAFEWDYVTEALSEIMKQVTYRNYYKRYFYVEGNNLGWRGRSGFKVIEVDNGEELLREVLPNTDCTFFVHRPKDKRQNEIVINNFHHDTRFSGLGGEWYTIRPMNSKAVEYWLENGYGWDECLEALL